MRTEYRIRVATWNMKHAVAPKKPLDELWRWLLQEVNADVVVITEGKVPKEGLPPGWTAVHSPEGIGPRRRWGTIVAARDPFALHEADFVRNTRGGEDFTVPVNGTVHSVDVFICGDYWATIVGAHGFLHHGRSGFDALLHIVDEVSDVYASERRRFILARDFNLWPEHILPLVVDDLGMVDIWANITGVQTLPSGVGGSRVWTHRNGNSDNAAQQELDYIFTTQELCDEIISICGGVEDFPDSWDMSDHAPIAVDFRFGSET